MSDKKHCVNYRDPHVNLARTIPLYPRENKPIFAGNATMDIAYAWPNLWGRCAVTTRG